MSSDMKLDEIVKAARFLQIEGAKDFDMNSLSASSNNNCSGMKMCSGEGTEEEVSLTAYCGDEGPEESVVRPFAWLSAQGRQQHEKHLHEDSSLPNSPSSFHSSDSFDSNGGLMPNGSPTIIVNGATGEFTTLYQQMSPINLKLSASTAENKQELKRKLLQKKRQLMLISNGVGSSSTAECTAQHLKKRACLEAERAAASSGAAHQTLQNTKLSNSSDLQVTLGGHPVAEPLSLLMNGSKRGCESGNRHEGSNKLILERKQKSAEYFDDLEDDNEHSLKIDENLGLSASKNDGAMDCSKMDVEESLRGDSNNNNHHHYQQQKQHEVKDNVVIVNPNSSKCLTLKIKSGKIYKDDQLPEVAHNGMFE